MSHWQHLERFYEAVGSDANLPEVRALLEEFPFLAEEMVEVELPRQFGRTPVNMVHYAMMKNAPQMATLLITTADLKDQATVKLALEFKQWEVVKFLFEFGADFAAPVVFYLACQAETVEVLAKVLDQHPNWVKVFSKDRTLSLLDGSWLETGATLLHVASAANVPAAVEVLLERKLPIDINNRRGHTPLIIAIERKAAAIVTLLLQRGAKATPAILKRALEQQMEESVICAFLDQGLDLTSQPAIEALHTLATQDKLVLVQLMVAKRVDIEGVDSYGNTALILALQHGAFKTALYLMEQNARVAWTEKDAQQPKQQALEALLRIENVDEAVPQALLDRGATFAGVSPAVVMDALCGENFQLAEMLIEKGVPAATYVDDYGLTCLHALARSQEDLNRFDEKRETDPNTRIMQEKLARVLLEQKADPSAALPRGHLIPRQGGVGTNLEGETALHRALEMKFASMANLLLDYGANPNASSKGHKFGSPVLNLALRYQLWDVAARLLEAQADPSSSDEAGRFSFVLAASNPSMAAKLLKGIDPRKAVDEEGSTPLVICAASPDVIRTLLQSKADPNQANKAGVTPLMVAAGEGSLDSVKLLLESKAQPHTSDAEGKTALTRARQQKQQNIVNFLEKYLDLGPLDIMLSYRIRETGAKELGGDGTVIELQQALQEMGFSVFVGESALQGGQAWASTIQSAVERARVFIPITSPTYGSESSSIWTYREIQMADNERRTILPIWHSGAYPPPGIKIFLSGTQRIPSGNQSLQEVGGLNAHVMRDLLQALAILGLTPSKETAWTKRVKETTEKEAKETSEVAEQKTEEAAAAIEQPAPAAEDALQNLVGLMQQFNLPPALIAQVEQEGQPSTHVAALVAILRALTARSS
eukprot:gb/GEZN01001937.1/.p1 GENE.gb/GEZN01001937.1/~~gb/GEZN01001937.1/.p1  ORF type:complete len:882 (+),score=199.54 gb/GEZN01001937.1/:56-2701(+)